MQKLSWISKSSYTAVCPPVRGDNPRAFARGLSPRAGGQLLCSHSPNDAPPTIGWLVVLGLTAL